MVEPDRIRRFMLEHHPVRGHVVQLEHAWQALREHAGYPVPVRDLLGEAMCAAALLASTLKFEGMLTLQLQGDGAVGLLVAQCTHDFAIRGVARFDDERVDEDFRKLVGDGRITVTVESADRAARYQGIVPLVGESLAACIDEYFATSEQLPTHVRLAADAVRAGGVLVQRMPTAGGRQGASEPEAAPEPDDPEATGADYATLTAEDAWEGVSAQLAILDDHDLLYVAPEALLRRAASVDDVRLFQGAPVSFQCRCSRERVATILRSLGRAEVDDVVREQGRITVTCEFCQRPQVFDPIDVVQIFADVPPPPVPGASRPN